MAAWVPGLSAALLRLLSLFNTGAGSRTPHLLVKGKRNAYKKWILAKITLGLRCFSLLIIRVSWCCAPFLPAPGLGPP